jgi:hypothetical protein
VKNASKESKGRLRNEMNVMASRNSWNGQMHLKKLHLNLIPFRTNEKLNQREINISLRHSR